MVRRKRIITYCLLCLLVALLAGFWLISLAEANFHYPQRTWMYTSIVIKSPSDWTMNENVTIAFTVIIVGSGDERIVGTVTSIQCLLDNNLIIEDANTRIFINTGSPQNLNYFKIVGPLTLGYHTIAVEVTAYTVLTGEETKRSASSTESKTFAVGFEPTPTPTQEPTLNSTQTPSPSPSPTLEPTSEPTLTPIPTANDNKTLDLKPILALAGIVTVAVAVSVSVYLKRRRSK